MNTPTANPIPDADPSPSLAARAWRPALVVSGVLAAAGGAMHPEAETSGSVGHELAEMAADPAWVTGHALVVLSAVLMSTALWGLHRRRGAAGLTTGAARALRLAAVAMSLYVVETVFHLAASVDTDAFAAGDFAPVTTIHIALAVVLYPLSGYALAALGLALARSWRGPRRAVACLAVLGGTLHSVSAPVALLLPDAPTTPLFAGAGMSLAFWAIGTGLLGAPRRSSREVPVDDRSLQKV